MSVKVRRAAAFAAAVLLAALVRLDAAPERLPKSRPPLRAGRAVSARILRGPALPGGKLPGLPAPALGPAARPEAPARPPLGPREELKSAESKSAQLRRDAGDSGDAEAKAAADAVFEPGTPRTQGYSPEAGLSRVLETAAAKGDLTRELAASLRDAGYRDHLTGLDNRLFLEENVSSLVASHKSLITFKLDNLKEINDSSGHEKGNWFVQAAAGAALRALGPEGKLVRRSPTKFDVFIDAPLTEAVKAAEALRAVIAAKLGKAPGGQPGTISLGVSEFAAGVPGREAYRAAFRAAEEARILAKEKGGGDRVAAHDGRAARLSRRRSLKDALSGLGRKRWAGLAGRVREVSRTKTSALLARSSKGPTPGELLAGVRDPRLFDALSAIIFRNALSGLLNRKWLSEHIEDIFAPGGYDHYMVLDIDHFGGINERLGEEKADLLLKELGALLREEAKAHDALALHLGGEEFALLTGPLTDPRAFAEGVRTKAAGLGFTVSIGAARIGAGGESAPRRRFSAAADAAEAALRRAKADGRDRVVFSPLL